MRKTWGTSISTASEEKVERSSIARVGNFHGGDNQDDYHHISTY